MMSCVTCNGAPYPYSQLGKSQTYGHNRSPKQRLETVRPTDNWQRFNAEARNGVVGPPSPQSLPISEQKYKHYANVEKTPDTRTASVPMNKGRKNRAKSFGVPQPPG